MEFTWINQQGVISDLGFVVQMVDRGCIEYRENNRTLSTEVELGMDGGQLCLLISPNSFTRWDDMSVRSSLDDAEQKRIERNFREAMAFQGVHIVAEYPDDQSM